MQSHYPAKFERIMGYTPNEWRMRLPHAIGPNPWDDESPSAACVHLGASGVLRIDWEALPPRVIALMQIPQMRVRFAFSGLDDAERLTFMRRFDLTMQKGGG